jgi:hypothetical protein
MLLQDFFFLAGKFFVWWLAAVVAYYIACPDAQRTMFKNGSSCPHGNRDSEK